MTNTTKITYPIQSIAAINDEAVLSQLPINIVDQLGVLQETGFHLMLNRRDLFYTHGLVQYVLGTRQAHVELD